MYLLCGQEVWSEPSMSAIMVPANGQTTTTKKSFICRFGWKAFPSTNIYIRVQFLFSKRGGGGVCFYWVACFYWDIYGICINSNTFMHPQNARYIMSIIIVFIIMYIYIYILSYIYISFNCIYGFFKACYGTNKFLLCDFCTFVQINK